ncbi:MAG TPA: hypothetical protein VG324_18280 [Blastocatellia bacterium]|nr:hypothetical protein [Blastocatellia bacterium]
MGTEIYAGTDTQGVFIRSGGAGSWDKLSHGLPVHAQVFDLAVSGRYVYAALYSKGLYRLDSGGGRWTKVGQVTPLEVLAQDSTLLAGYNPGGVYRSVDEDYLRQLLGLTNGHDTDESRLGVGLRFSTA